MALSNSEIVLRGFDAFNRGDFRDGRVARVEFHLDPDAALRSAGVDPHSFQE
jgi:ketosteroid isomerase-like protein